MDEVGGLGGGYEILDVSSGRVDYVIELVEDAESLAADLDLDFVTRAEGDRPPQPGKTGRQWCAWVGLVLAFGLGLAAGVAPPSQAGQPAATEAQVSLVAGHVTVTGRANPETGSVPVDVSLLASGARVEVLSLVPLGWHGGQDGAARRAVAVHPGYWRNVQMHVYPDCQQPPTAARTEVEAHIRTDEGDSTVVIPLPRRELDLIEAWRELCSATAAPSWPHGQVP